MKTKVLVCACAACIAANAQRPYPAPWGADASTPEKRAALTEKLWRHDVSRDVKIWPEGKIPFKVSDRPMKFLEHELNQSNVVVTDVNVPQYPLYASSTIETRNPKPGTRNLVTKLLHFHICQQEGYFDIIIVQT